MFNTYSLTCCVANALTAIVGVILLIAGFIYARDTNFLRSSWNEIYSLSIYSIVIGILAMLFAICLFYVANRKLSASTILFSVLILIVFVLAVINLIILTTSVRNVKDDSYKKIADLFRNYSNSNSVVSSKVSFGEIQQSFQCCGVKEALDWKTQLSNGTNTPDTCCRTIVPKCGENALITKDKIYLRGCAEPIYLYLLKIYSALLAIDTILTILLFISAVCGFICEQYIREQYQAM
ncbi:unnamed protein product [Rotaria sp. Silwood1]|nr:unnamed protein product [Rotaria sp. Silwood1]CAF1619443.1 unnamed protein product [Rotaria sp. Silwood1]CAF3752042.1 unnamed protein product [Rotaria sp. Silwood1]CAF3765874.1 unnamed protein product [Rotaria sp. Silwood1]CAF3783819.1 unnamed protein product [Rotaria sp. Silwood1]